MAMDRAAKVVRRSGVRLLSLGGGHSDLNMLISEQKDVRNSSKQFMTAQNSSSQYLMKWATNEENRAIQDVSTQMVELNMVWTEAQRDFLEHLKNFKHTFELILEGEKHIDQAKNNMNMCEQREAKIKKELKKVVKKATPEEIIQLESRLSQAERAKDLAQLEVQDRIREHSAVKLIRFKEGVLKLSEAYEELGKKCSIVFEAQRDIAHLLPDVHDHDIDEIKYTGSGATRFYVQQAKENVRQYKRQRHEKVQQCEERTRQKILVTGPPPPPYELGDYVLPETQDVLPEPQESQLVVQEQTTNNQINTRQRRRATASRQQSTDDMEMFDWDSGGEDDLSGAMGGMRL